VVAQMNYRVKAERDEGWWLLTVPDVPGAVSQVKRLTQAQEYIREAIAFVLDVPAGSFTVTIDPALARGQDQITEARRQSHEAEAAQRRAAALAREVVDMLMTREGLSGAETAAVLGVSPQRVSQLRKDGRVVAMAKGSTSTDASSARAAVTKSGKRRRTPA
jgi:predicted RNase H-like HicB family nuclease/DNA-binding CsgD family transcriptional regulator